MKTKSSKIKHAVILVNYQVATDTLACIDSIKRSKDTPHIIVVDNGSSDSVLAELRSHYPDLDLIPVGENIGFSAANNLGIRKALKLGAKVVYLLNNDTEVDPSLFFRAYRYVEGKNRLAGAKIYYTKGYEYHTPQIGQGSILWYAGGYMNWNTVVSNHLGVDEVDHGQYDKVCPTDFVTGCFMAIPKQVFKKIGFLDEQFFLYLEDSDYSLRAHKLKVETMYNPNLVVYHRNSSSSGAGSPLVDYYLTRNRFIIAKRYGTLRLRFALLREAIFRSWSNPVRRAAFLDYLTGHLGKRR